MLTNTTGKSPTGNAREKAGCILLLIILVIISAGVPGCIKVLQQSANTTQVLEPPHPDPARTPVPADSVFPGQKKSPSQPALPVTTAPTDLVTDSAPILPPDLYPLQHGTQINETSQTNRHVQYAEFTRTYVLRGNATGLVINATTMKGPLWIHFDVKPLYDCLEKPESCRGEPGQSISRPYFTLTVRDNQTREIVAEDGYGGVFSSQKENRTIKIYKEGQYHLTLTGNSINVTLSVATGAAPSINDTQSAGPAATAALSQEYQRYLRQTERIK